MHPQKVTVAWHKRQLDCLGLGISLPAENKVLFNGQASERLFVTSGIAQGSVLGLVLFTIYIKKLEKRIK